MPTNKFSSALTNFINQSSFTDETLAAMVGVSNTAVRKWKSGKLKPTPENLERLAPLMNTDVPTLMRWSDIEI